MSSAASRTCLSSDELGNQVQSRAIRGNQVQSASPAMSSAIRCNQGQSGAIRCNQPLAPASPATSSAVVDGRPWKGELRGSSAGAQGELGGDRTCRLSSRISAAIRLRLASSCSRHPSASAAASPWVSSAPTRRSHGEGQRRPWKGGDAGRCGEVRGALGRCGEMQSSAPRRMQLR